MELRILASTLQGEPQILGRPEEFTPSASSLVILILPEVSEPLTAQPHSKEPVYHFRVKNYTLRQSGILGSAGQDCLFYGHV